MQCKKCGSENLGVMVDITISMPIKYYYALTKSAFRSKDIKMWGANWPKADIICHDCCYSTGLEREQNNADGRD